MPELSLLKNLSGNSLADYIVTDYVAFGFLEDPIFHEISLTLLAGITCIVTGFLFKLAVAPFHF